MPHPYRARPLESEPAMVPLRSLTAERRNACCGEAVCPRETIERLLFDPDPVPLVEAVRLALERDVPLHFIDIDLDDYPLHNEQLPDSYAVQRIGLAPFAKTSYCVATLRSATPDSICFTSLGHCWGHLPQVVQRQMSSVSISVNPKVASRTSLRMLNFVTLFHGQTASQRPH